MAGAEKPGKRRKKILQHAQPGIINGKHFTAQVLSWLGVPVSWWTLKGILTRAGFSYRRVKKSLKNSRDELLFSFFAQEIKQLRSLSEQIDLWFYDETSFHLNPTVPYAWQGKNTECTLPAQRGNVLTVAGFMQINNTFEGYYHQGSMDQDLMIAYIDDFMAKRVSRKTVVIMDPASFHTAAKVRKKIKEWQGQNLFIQWLPAYCSELNLIENLWRMIQHEWLPLWAYQSAQALTQHLLDILQNIGSKYRISFA